MTDPEGHADMADLDALTAAGLTAWHNLVDAGWAEESALELVLQVLVAVHR